MWIISFSFLQQTRTIVSLISFYFSCHEQHFHFVKIPIGGRLDEIGTLVGTSGHGSQRSQIGNQFLVSMPCGIVQGTATPAVAPINFGALFDEVRANGQVAFAGSHVQGGAAVVIAKINVIGSDLQKDVHTLQVAEGGRLQQLAAFGEFVGRHVNIRVLAHAHLHARIETGFGIVGIVHAAVIIIVVIVHIIAAIDDITFAMVTGRYIASTAAAAARPGMTLAGRGRARDNVVFWDRIFFFNGDDRGARRSKIGRGHRCHVADTICPTRRGRRVTG